MNEAAKTLMKLTGVNDAVIANAVVRSVLEYMKNGMDFETAIKKYFKVQEKMSIKMLEDENAREIMTDYVIGSLCIEAHN